MLGCIVVTNDEPLTPRYKRGGDCRYKQLTPSRVGTSCYKRGGFCVLNELCKKPLPHVVDRYFWEFGCIELEEIICQDLVGFHVF